MAKGCRYCGAPRAAGYTNTTADAFAILRDIAAYWAEAPEAMLSPNAQLGPEEISIRDRIMATLAAARVATR